MLNCQVTNQCSKYWNILFKIWSKYLAPPFDQSLSTW